jgi:hypothetical protein
MKIRLFFGRLTKYRLIYWQIKAISPEKHHYAKSQCLQYIVHLPFENLRFTFFDCFILSSTIDYFNTENTKFTEDEQSSVVLGTDYELFWQQPLWESRGIHQTLSRLQNMRVLDAVAHIIDIQ